jgi:hypothetical protein
MGWLSDTTSSKPTSPPSGPMTRARAKALHHEVNSLLSTCDFDTPLDGVLLDANTLCIIRYQPQERHPSDQDIEPRSKHQGEEAQPALGLVLPLLEFQAGTTTHTAGQLPTAAKTGTTACTAASLPLQGFPPSDTAPSTGFLNLDLNAQPLGLSPCTPLCHLFMPKLPQGRGYLYKGPFPHL